MTVKLTSSAGLYLSNGVLKMDREIDKPLSVTLVIDGEEDTDVLVEDPDRFLEIIRKLLWINSIATLKLLNEIEAEKYQPGIQILN